jgi:CRISPR/Cas system CMR-associated protein Cmr3 (group 5 of RAMP superfamily)
MIEAFEKIAKDAAVRAHKLMLSQKRIAELKAINKADAKRKSRKRKKIYSEEMLTVEEGVRLTTLKEFNARSNGKKGKKRARVEEGEPS